MIFKTNVLKYTLHFITNTRGTITHLRYNVVLCFPTPIEWPSSSRTSMQSVLITTNVVISLMCTTVCKKSLAVTCGRSMIFPGHSGFLHQ